VADSARAWYRAAHGSKAAPVSCLPRTHLRRVRDLLTPVSRARYLLWRASKSRGALDVATASGDTLVLRGPPSTDLLTAYEIFLAGAYEPPSGLLPLEPKLVVDLGAHVGFTVLLWARRFPSARIVAFEPHPEHLELLYRHVLQNGLAERVEIVAGGASNRSERGFLTNQECRSHVVESAFEAGYRVRMRDVFEELQGERVDFLKMDIEGGEFEILSDPRFAAVGVPVVVLEWHDTKKTPSGKAWCTERLTELGYRVANGKLSYPSAGVIWASRS
jgi:FkbM family methyltransferase